ncbi:MAG: hypothetical protein R3D66_02645 [Alphaproteobacteria bacterium]
MLVQDYNNRRQLAGDTDNLIEITDNVADDGKFRDKVPLFAGLERFTRRTGSSGMGILRSLRR